MVLCAPLCKFFIVFSFIAPQALLSYSQTDTVKIGLLVQDKQSVAAMQGAELAIREANMKSKERNYYTLEIRDMEGPWGTGAKVAVDLVFGKEVRAVIGAVDGRNSHLAEQVSAKTNVPYISALSGDPTLGQAFIPWFFSCVANDNQVAALITGKMRKTGCKKAVIISDDGYDSKMASSALQKKCIAENIAVSNIIYYSNFKDQLPEIQKGIQGGECITYFGSSFNLASLLKSLGNKTGSHLIFAPYILISDNGANLKDIHDVHLLDPGSFFYNMKDPFTAGFLEKYGTMPGPAAAYSYDAVNIVIESLRNSGYERQGLYRAISQIRHHGITGEISFDEHGNRKTIPGLIKSDSSGFIRIED